MMNSQNILSELETIVSELENEKKSVQSIGLVVKSLESLKNENKIHGVTLTESVKNLRKHEDNILSTTTKLDLLISKLDSEHSVLKNELTNKIEQIGSLLTQESIQTRRAIDSKDQVLSQLKTLLFFAITINLVSLAGVFFVVSKFFF